MRQELESETFILYASPPVTNSILRRCACRRDTVVWRVSPRYDWTLTLTDSQTRSILLGPLRFSLINQAARAALELGGFLEEREGKGSKDKGSKKAK